MLHINNLFGLVLDLTHIYCCLYVVEIFMCGSGGGFY